MTKIVGFKMSNGDEIVAKVVDEDESMYSHVRVLVATQEGAGLIPWLFLPEDKPVQITPIHIMVQFPLTAEQEKAYLASVSSIQLVG